MKREKPYTPIFIVTSKQDYDELNAKQGEFYIAIEAINPAGFFDENLIKMMFTNQTPFMFLFNNDELKRDLTPQKAELINLSFFSKNYIRLNGAPVISFIETEKKQASFTTKLINDNNTILFERQGWQDIHKWELLTSLSLIEQLEQRNNSALFIDKINFDDALLLQHFLNSPENCGQHIFFRSSPTEKSSSLENDFFLRCEIALNKNPTLDAYLNKYLLEKKLSEKIFLENKKLHEQLNNAEITIRIIRTKYKDDYDILFNWYQKEYEVLPLWFKRIGHILKAIAGKRSFKSLFSDDEKKKAAAIY